MVILNVGSSRGYASSIIQEEARRLIGFLNACGASRIQFQLKHVTREACCVASMLQETLIIDVQFPDAAFPAPLLHRALKLLPEHNNIEFVAFKAFTDQVSVAAIASVLSTLSCLKAINLLGDGDNSQLVAREDLATIIHALRKCRLEIFKLSRIIVPWTALDEFEAIVNDELESLSIVEIDEDVQDAERNTGQEFDNFDHEDVTNQQRNIGQLLVDSLLSTSPLIQPTDLIMRLMSHCADDGTPMKHLDLQYIFMKRIGTAWEIRLVFWENGLAFQRLVSEGVASIRNLKRLEMAHMDVPSLHPATQQLFQNPSCSVEEFSFQETLDVISFPEIQAALSKYTNLRKISLGDIDMDRLANPTLLNTLCLRSSLHEVDIGSQHASFHGCLLCLAEVLRTQPKISHASVAGFVNLLENDETAVALSFNEFESVLHEHRSLEILSINESCWWAEMERLFACLKIKSSLRTLDLSQSGLSRVSFTRVAAYIRDVATLQQLLFSSSASWLLPSAH